MRALDAGAGIRVRAQRGDAMGRRLRFAQRVGGEIADIAVAFELDPGPAVAGFIDLHGFTVQRLGLVSRGGVGAFAQGDARGRDFGRDAFDEFSGWNLAAQMRGGEVGTGGGQAGIGHGGEQTGLGLTNPWPWV